MAVPEQLRSSPFHVTNCVDWAKFFLDNILYLCTKRSYGVRCANPLADTDIFQQTQVGYLMFHVLVKSVGDLTSLA